MHDSPPAYIGNERWKSVSRTLFQLGSALLAAAAVRLYGSLTFDWTLALWSIGAGALISGGWKVLSLLESEKDG